MSCINMLNYMFSIMECLPQSCRFIQLYSLSISKTDKRHAAFYPQGWNAMVWSLV